MVGSLRVRFTVGGGFFFIRSFIRTYVRARELRGGGLVILDRSVYILADFTSALNSRPSLRRVVLLSKVIPKIRLDSVLEPPSRHPRRVRRVVPRQSRLHPRFSLVVHQHASHVRRIPRHSRRAQKRRNIRDVHLRRRRRAPPRAVALRHLIDERRERLPDRSRARSQRHLVAPSRRRESHHRPRRGFIVCGAQCTIIMLTRRRCIHIIRTRRRRRRHRARATRTRGRHRTIHAREYSLHLYIVVASTNQRRVARRRVSSSSRFIMLSLDATRRRGNDRNIPMRWMDLPRFFDGRVWCFRTMCEVVV